MKSIRLVTEKQIAALKYLVFHSRDANDLAKRIVAYLIEQSNGLVDGVCITLCADRQGYSAEEINTAAHHFGGMLSCNCNTHLSALMSAIGSDMHFSHHYGDFNPKRKRRFSNDGQFAGLPPKIVSGGKRAVKQGMPLRYTFWLSLRPYTTDARFCPVMRKDLDTIDLERPGLYPELEEIAQAS